MNKILSLDNVHYSIPHSDSILEGISLELHENQFFGVLGQNGAGKTTLMDLILGIREVTKGTLRVLGEDPHALDRKLRNKIVFISQDVGLKSSITIREFLKFHSGFYPAYSYEEEKRLLQVFDLDPKSKIGSLSTGQQRKVQIVAGIAARPQLILIDEITAVLDPTARSIFFKEIKHAKDAFGCSVLLATNIAEDLIERADKILFLSGKKASLHSPAEIGQLFNIKKGVA